MAIGLSNVNGRKAPKSKRETPEKKFSGLNATASTVVAATPAELKSSGEPWSTRGLAREGRSVRRERGIAADDLNPLWLDWTACVAGSETSTRISRTVQRILDLEMFVFEFLVYDLDIPARAKKRILGIRSRGARALQLKKLLLGGK